MKLFKSLIVGGILIGAVFFTCGKNDPKQNTNNTPKAELSLVAESEQLWTGVAVSREGRIFVNYPRWSPLVTVSVGEISASGDVAPFPNEDWNTWTPGLDPADHFICVQSVYVDHENYLWVLDPANPLFQGVVTGGAKLLKVDLQSGQVIQKIIFDASIAPSGSYLNDLRVDTDLGYAYLTESGMGTIIVVNLNTGESRRVLHSHPSTKAENIILNIEGQQWGGKVHSDGLALDLTREYLYYQALTGRSLYRIKTEFLRDTSLTEAQLGEKVEFVIESGASDAIEFGPDGNLYLTSLEHNAIRRFTSEGKVEKVFQDSRLKWPDSFSITPDGTIYVTTSQLHLGNNPAEPYRIFKIVQR
jgi:sugar lactone lactonase YvrE